MTLPRWLRRFAVACVTLLVVLLPVLTAARGLGSPPTAAERQRLEWATADHAVDGSEIVRQFCLAFVATEPWPPEAAAQDPFVHRARLAQVAAVLGVSVCLYLAMLLAHGRVHALLACAALAMLPAVATRGHELRPEAPAALFVGLGLVLLTCFAQQASRRRRSSRSRGVQLAGLSVCACLANGFAVAALPTTGECLLVPGGMLVLGSLQMLVRMRRVLRRGGWLRLPIRAINARLLPWTATALLMPAAALGMLTLAVGGRSEALLPTPGCHWAAELGGGPLLPLLAFGLVANVLRVGLRFGRGGRLGPDLLVFVFVVAFLIGALRADGEDGLPAAAAAAACVGDGGGALLVLAHGVWQRRRGRR